VAHQAGIAIENAWLYEASQRHGEELEERVRERTEKILSMQEAQSKFLTDVSHELQTPMAVFKSNMEVLMGKHNGNKKTALAVMATTLECMSSMIGHLLAAARLNFSKEKLHKKEIAVENLLEEAYHDCFILAEDKGVLLSYASEPIRIMGGWEQLKEVILNLISNALKHTASGGKIVLRGKVLGERAEISVEDTGSGIAPEDLPHIFDRFYRIRADACLGTGLGLDICKKIIELHGGNIRAESELGEGSRFIVSLPHA
jgi:signal transduction histidine kinase